MQYNSKTDAIANKYRKRMSKRSSSKPFPVRLLMERTFNTAVWVMELIQDIPFQKLASDVYFFCNDVGFKPIVRLYDAQLELAGISEEKFIFGLHSFYNDISSKIKKNHQFPEFMEFLGTVMRIRFEKKGSIDERIIDAYTNLILQTLEYIRPDKFNLDVCVYGVSTDGELLTGPYPYAYSDVPALNFQAELEKRPFRSKSEAMDFLIKEYRKVGIDIHSSEDIDILEQTQRVHINTTTSLLPFINEYTYDIVPQTTYTSLTPPLSWMKNSFDDVEVLVQRLKHRRRTLPSNGVRFEFDDPTGELKQLLIKEVVHFDGVYFLYRLETVYGDLSGYYETDSGYLYSITREASSPIPYQNLTALLLVLYASQVIEGNFLEQFSGWFTVKDMPLAVRTFGIGGKLRDTYHKGDSVRIVCPRDPEQYGHKEKAINGFIRRLPEGQSASEEAKELAAQYGYELADNETYVRPFIKQVFVKKET